MISDVDCLVVAGPSGVGKSTLIREVLKVRPDWTFSISATTREPREGEVDGRDYYYLSRDSFLDRVNAGQFVEYADVYGKLYGTPISEFERARSLRQRLLIEVDSVGCMNLKAVMPRVPIVGLLPPSYNVLRHRLVSRQTESENSVKLRLANVWMELTRMRSFDFAIVNDDLDMAIGQLAALMDLIDQGLWRVESRVTSQLEELKELTNEA
jgi:guanylate kinase